jgi:uncharacterized membrane protein
MPSNVTWLEVAVVVSAFALLIAYHAALVIRLKRNPTSTAIGINNRARLEWTRYIITNKRDILAVQTLRNLTMAASFLASTTIIVALGLLSYALTSESLITFSHTLNRLGSNHPELVLFKFLFLICVFLFAFFNYTLAIRYYNHSAFLLNIPVEPIDEVKIKRVGNIVNRGAIHYTSGMRASYLIIPFAMWLVGPEWLFAGTLILLAVLYRVDYRHDLQD